MSVPIRVLIVDDDALVRGGLSLMLSGSDAIKIVGEAEDGAAALEAAATLGPDIILMDIRMPGMDGLTALERLHARSDRAQVIVLTTFDSDDQVVRALRAGAAGFLLKDTPPAEIVRAIERVAEGEPMLSPAIVRQLITQVTDGGGADKTRVATERLAELTDRERDVADAIADGCSNAEIAEALHLSVASVKAIVTRVFQKLEVSNRVQVAILVRDGGV